MGSGEPTYPPAFEHPVEKSPGTAVGIAHENAPVSTFGRIQTLLDRGRDQIGGVMQSGGKTFDVDPIQRVETLHIEDLTGQRPASDHQQSITLVTH
jgi:hypothetical protein